MKRIERRVFGAFKTADNAIKFSFAPFSGQELELERERVFLDPEDLARGLTPSLEVEINHEALEHETGLSIQDLRFSITSKDHEAKLYEVIFASLVAEVPRRISLRDTDPIKPASGIELDLLVHLDRELDAAPNRPHRKGSVVARQTILVGLERDASSFPVVPKAPEDFERMHLPPTTLWYVNFLQDTVDAPVSSVVEVWINSEARNKLNRVFGSSRAGHLVAANMASEMFATIALETLKRSSAPPTNPAGEGEEATLLSAVVEKLGAELGVDYAELRRIADGDDADQRFRALAQAAFGMTNEIARWN